MEIPPPKALDEVAELIWASHILSYWNPYTTPMSDNPLRFKHTPSVNGETDDEEYDDSPSIDKTSTDAATLTLGHEVLWEKFLNSISELLAHTKGGKHVTAAALREKEDSIEIDLARNTGFRCEDQEYISSLARFLSRQGERFSQKKALDDHSFLRETIVYNTNRVQYGVEKVLELLKGPLLHPIHCSSSGSQSQDLTCMLGCCSEEHPHTASTIEGLISKLLYLDFLKAQSSALFENDDQMCQIVELAALTLDSPQESHSKLKGMLPCVDPYKVMRKLRALARLVTDVRILSHIARLLPSFRSVIFAQLSPPDPVRLQNRHKQTLGQAWKKLQLPAVVGGLPNDVAKERSQFKSDCSRTHQVHCEIQLLARYEAEPSLKPTHPYLGCSKKACFLCARFLALSSLKLRVRGCHGQCHPSWGIPLLSLKTMQPRIKPLCDAIKERLQLLIQPEEFSKTVAVQQSSAVSDLKSTDILMLERQHALREIADKQSQEYRQNMQIMLNPRSVGPRRIFYRDLKTLCVICQLPRPENGLCHHCRSNWYCSKRCEQLDRPAHSLLCSQYLKFQESRPSATHKIGIWFPRDMKEPKLVWTPIVSRMNEYHADFDSFLGPKHSVLFTLPVEENKMRGLTLDHQITIYYQDWVEAPAKTNQSIQHAVEVCPGKRIPYDLCGDYVAMSGRRGDPPSKYLDIDCADFRHILDFFSTYADGTIRETPSGGTVRAVQINCPLEQRLKGCEEFQSVMVDRDFPSTKMVSELSMALEDPMWICKLDRDELKNGAMLLDELPENPWQNLNGEILATDIDPKSDGWGMSSRSPWNFDGSVLVMRRYGRDLDVEWLQHICAYYLEVLPPLFAKTSCGEISRDDVLAEITCEKIMKWKSVVIRGAGDVTNVRLQRGFVKSMAYR